MTSFKAKDITLTGSASAKTKFCELWPAAKAGLEALKAIVKNPFVKLAIEGILAAGDALSKSICG